MNWLYYLAEANIYLGVFYIAYCLLLNRGTHYQLSRAYLVVSCIVSFILPVVQIGALRPVPVIAGQLQPVGAAIYTLSPAPVPAEHNIVERHPPTASANVPVLASGHHFTLQDGLWYAYLTGAAVLLVLLFIKLYTLFRLAANAQSVQGGQYKVVYLPGPDFAFSFFGYLFIGADAPGADTIITHELVHIRQKHSADIIFLELLKIISWFTASAVHPSRIHFSIITC
jgi:hypothetical protein